MPYEHTLAALRRARSTTQRIARQSATEYCQQLCEGIHRNVDSGKQTKTCTVASRNGQSGGVKESIAMSIQENKPRRVQWHQEVLCRYRKKCSPILKSLTGEKITDREQQITR
ncbi:hypothetical protein CHS0354_036792 [Potamilus streckersoni]|uniref:Uncharacterized protein n=1 Tax=Potamilus streckersoni TaxID=2493646 RepID=A0AAE0SJ74_9BIVA|nr:hypothetical protein CHS0354_036792 [Potamilus streckersoni]